MLRSRSSRFETRVVVIVSALILSTAACGGGSNSSSTPTALTSPAPAAAATATLTGQVVSLNGGAPNNSQPEARRHQGRSFDGVLAHTPTLGCDVFNDRRLPCYAMPSSAERFHASIAYARPVGNTDPDIDPNTTIRLTPQTVKN
jgi:hypothetical protein